MNLSVQLSNTKHHKPMIVKAIIFSLLMVLPACKIPSLRQAETAPDLPAGFNTSTNSGAGQPAGLSDATSSENSSQLGIDDFFSDPVLTHLIHQSLAGNRELRILTEEAQIARNDILARRGAYLPFVTAGAGAGVEKPSKYTPQGAVEEQLEVVPGKAFPDPLGNFQLGAYLSWQLDIWGQLRYARDAAVLRYRAATEKRNYFVTRLVAETAENYFRLMALDIRLETLDKTIAIQEQSLKVAKANQDAGRGTALAVQRFQAEVHKNQSEKLIVRQEIVEVENKINFLVNRFPMPVERSSATFLDLNVRKLSAGVPSQLLQNRPDIRQAERELEAAGLDIEVAKANFYPSLNITGGIGYQAFNTKYLLRTPEAMIASIAGDLVAPLINKTAIQAEYMNANARQLQAVYNYQRVILNAFTEVVNRISMVENYRKSIDIKKLQLESLEASVDSATKLFQSARAEYIDVLFSQRDLLEARTVLIETKKRQLEAVVNAYQALGGGDLLVHSDPRIGEFTALEDIKLLGGHPECAPPAYPAFMQDANRIPLPMGDPLLGQPATNPVPTNGILPPPKSTVPAAPSSSRLTKPADVKSPVVKEPMLPSPKAPMPATNPPLPIPGAVVEPRVTTIPPTLLRFTPE